MASANAQRYFFSVVLWNSQTFWMVSNKEREEKEKEKNTNQERIIF